MMSVLDPTLDKNDSVDLWVVRSAFAELDLNLARLCEGILDCLIISIQFTSADLQINKLVAWE